MIRIQTEDFTLQQEYDELRKDAPVIGAIVTFTGLVRDIAPATPTALFLEHYPAMTNKVLADIISQAKQRWDIINTRIIHRIGHLTANEQIVFVGVNSAHRKDAFSACEFMMDFLKTDAPFWKKEITTDAETWVEAKDTDKHAKQRWQSDDT